MTDGLPEWLRAQLDEDERIARSAGGVVYVDWAEGGWVEAEASKAEWKGPGDDGRHVGSVRRAEDRAHIAEHDPARVLREIEAKRQALARYEFACRQAADERSNSEEEREVWVQVAGALQSVVLCFAAIYADRPGYDEAVRP